MDHTPPTSWEHLIEECATTANLEKTLNERGRDGWELVNVACPTEPRSLAPVKTMRARPNGAWWAFFKRPVR